MVRFFLIAVIFFSALVNSFAQSISANAFTDTTDYLVGDYIPLIIKVKYDKGIYVQNPSLSDVLNGVELIKTEEPFLTEESDKPVVLFKYIISKYDSTDVEISSIPVLYKVGNDTSLQVAYTNPVYFTVHTLLVNPGEDIADVKEPIKIPWQWWEILLYALVPVLVLILAYFLYRRYKKKKEKIVEREPNKLTPSYITALNALHELEQKELWQKGLVKEYHSKITEIIRRYFEDRFYLPALELTTNEALRRLNDRRDTFEIIEITEQFLNNADLVKFAKYKPIASVNSEMIKQAYEIVERTIPKERTDRKEVLISAR